MNANKLADDLDNANGFQYLAQLGLASQAATMLRQQQAEIEALKKRCLDEIFKTTYADRSAEVICGQLEKAQAEIEALKKHNEELQKACVDSLVWVMGNGVYCSLDIEVILKNVLGSEWEDYK